jgi:hypothetical protein
MAHRRARRVGFGGIAHRTAEAAAFDLHLDSLALFSSRLKNRMSATHTWCPPYGQDQLRGQPPGAEQTGPDR